MSSAHRPFPKSKTGLVHTTLCLVLQHSISEKGIIIGSVAALLLLTRVSWMGNQSWLATALPLLFPLQTISCPRTPGIKTPKCPAMVLEIWSFVWEQLSFVLVLYGSLVMA